jgi:hypothetical protein
MLNLSERFQTIADWHVKTKREVVSEPRALSFRNP